MDSAGSETIDPTIRIDMDEDAGVICLRSGRTGCDSQMLAVASKVGTVLDPTDAWIEQARLVAVTGPENARQAVALSRRLGIPVVGFGQPGAAADMDLVVTTPQFDVHGRRVLRLPFAISPHGTCEQDPDSRDARLAASLPGPVGLLLVGGDAGPWRLTADVIGDALARVARRNQTVVVVTSRRTSEALRVQLRASATPRVLVDGIDGTEVRLAALIHACDEAFVTGDSVSMISEVAAAGRRVAVVEPDAANDEIDVYLEKSAEDPLAYAMPGDLRRFWRTLGPGAATPIMHPRSSGVLRSAVDAVRAIMTPSGAAAA
ncbi:MAG: mitochondrial fission ELM1 family protein [Burkholderiaceae bacterium]|nr:mitochondrial fission ELM1 family protein [Burkholderiaceae bacterium]